MNIKPFKKAPLGSDRFSTVLCYDTGDTLRYKNNVLHSVKKPAVETKDGHKIWFKEGILHRDDGPAHTGPNNIEEYWINGVRVSPNVVIDIILAKLKRETEHKELFIRSARNERILRFENSDKNINEIKEIKESTSKEIQSLKQELTDAHDTIVSLNLEPTKTTRRNWRARFFLT